MYLSVHISTIYNSQDVEATQAFERVKGRKARGLQAEETGRKCQTFFLSPLSGGRKQTTSVRFFFLLHTKLKGAFSMEMFFLSYVNESMYLLWNLSFFKMVPPKTNFFFSSNLGLIIAQQTSIHINCFMAGRWHTSSHPISKMHIVGEGPGETPSASRCLSYLINSFLTDIKQLAKD